MKQFPRAEKTGLFAKLINVARYGKRELSAAWNFVQENRLEKPDGPIRVAFLCDYVPAWNKVKPMYERMLKDSRFSPVLLCVPSDISSDPAENDIYDYFCTHGYPEAVNTHLSDGNWLDLKTLGLTYIIYLRPYNYELPKPYENFRVARYCKVCMVLYGMIMSEELMKSVMERNFMRHVYCYFAETPQAARNNRRYGWLLHGLKLQKSVFLGLPGKEEILASQAGTTHAWDFTQNEFRAIWTPRWTKDPALGGTNFFEYYQVLPEFAKEHPEMAFLFRPHPMALTHFVQAGDMTAEEAEEFRRVCREIPNLSLDEEKDYLTTMWQSSVLISDKSGIMPEYFLMNKPLIFCASNLELTMAEHTRKMLEGCYVVYNKQELFACLQQLQQGIDPLAQRRQELIEELFGGIGGTPSESMMEELVKDCRK